MAGIESTGSDAASASSSGHCSPGYSGIVDDPNGHDQRDRLSSISSTSTNAGMPLAHSVEGLGSLASTSDRLLTIAESSSNCSETSASPASDCGDSR
ncbi:hypothetical protein AAVH_34577, partial [Aphelenchoides avenae]